MCWLPVLLAAMSACFPILLQAQSGGIPAWRRPLPRPAYESLERLLPDEPWFEVYLVKPGVFAIYEPREFQEVISYLILGDKRALLLDTGMGMASIKKVVSRLTQLPITVLNTHTHPDHVGGNYEFQEIRGFDLDYTRHNAAGMKEEYLKDWVTGDNVWGPLPEGFDPGKYEIAPFKITQYIHDGEEIDLGQRKLKVIRTPGHTPDSLCLYDMDHRLLFTGDTFYAGAIYLFVPETDLSAYIQSVALLEKMSGKLDALIPSHNEPIASPEMLSRLLKAAKQIEAGSVEYKITDGLREYGFDGFSVLRPR